MSFDIFENIYTASDPAGGRAIKVSTLTGIDNAESYYTQTDPAGGRAIKVKIIAGGASTGTLQVQGGVALDGTYRNITDSASTPNSSILQLTTGAVKVNGLFTVAGATYAADVFIRDLSARYIVFDYTLRIGSTGYLKIGNQALTDPYNFAPGTNAHSGLYYSGFNKDFALPYHSFTGLDSYWTSGGVGDSLTSPVGIAFFKGNFGIQTTATNTPSDFRMLNVVYDINNTQSASGKTFNGICVDSTQTNLNNATHNLVDLRVGGVSRFKVLNSGLTTLKTTTPSTGTTNNVLSLAPLDVASSSAFYNSPALSFDVSAWNGSSAVTRSFKMFAKTFGGVAQNDPEFNIFGPTDVQLMRLNTSSLGLSVTGIAADASAGFSIATATSQKIAFWGATPIVQPTTAVAAATFVASSGTTVNDASTFDGYTIKQVVKALRNTGLLQ